MNFQKYAEGFLFSCRAAPVGSLARLLDLEREAALSFFLESSPIQDAFRFRARYWGLKIANLLIDTKGDLQKEMLFFLIDQLSAGFFSLGPKREGDAMIQSHLISCLKALKEGEAWRACAKLSVPLCHKAAEEMIRETLWPDTARPLQDFHVRRAGLAAWLTLLRQTTGSCFATAPAILIQKKPLLFFKDLQELLSTGQLKRVVLGKEYAVPMCLATEAAELNQPIRSLENLAFSPGLIGALEAAQFFSSNEPLEKKAHRLQLALRELDEIKTPKQVLRALILKGVDLTEEEVADEENLVRMQISPLMAKDGAVFYQRQSLRAQKVAEWKKRLQSACRAFQSLTECFLLRSWEYTLACLCDVKTDFSKWNLYVGLGMQLNEEAGIADFLYREIEQKLQECNEEIASLQRQYQEAAHAIRSLEALFHRSSDSQRYKLQVDLAEAVHAAQTALNVHDRKAMQAKEISQFFSLLLRHYDAKFQEYFQEVFDPAVAKKEEEIFEDSPAGFRLLYKHGRRDASAWTLIYDEDEYIRSLRSFFSAVESEIEVSSALGKEFVSEITTSLIQFIQRPEFLEAAKQRALAAGRQTPWDYVSGGTMQSLVQIYFARSEPVVETTVFPQSEKELLDFLSAQKKENGLLMHSPTHAFVLQLNLLGERAAEDVEENRLAAKKWRCGEVEQEHIGHLLSEKLPAAERALFLHLFRQKNLAETPMQLRRFLFESLPGSKVSPALIESHLYEHIFFVAQDKAREALRSILCSFSDLPQNKAAEAIARADASFLGSYALHQTAKSIVFEILRTPAATVDWDERIAARMRQLGYAFPHLVLFADTNWSEWFFGFVANPFTESLELWRLNRTGLRGFPMSDWKQWFSKHNQLPWVLLFRKEQYG